jgi:putative transposase
MSACANPPAVTCPQHPRQQRAHRGLLCWQARPLDALYPILYLDCIHVKVRDAGAVRNKAVFLAIGVNMDGHKEVLGLWIAQTERAKFWLQVVTKLKNRGVQDIFIACGDGLQRLPRCDRNGLPQGRCPALL